MPIALTDPAQLATPPIRRGKKDGGRRNDRGKERRREGGREGDEEKEKKTPQIAEMVMKQKPKCNCHVLSSTSGFFFPTRVSATALSTAAVPRRGHWGLQPGPAVRRLRQDCLATMAFLRREERTLLSALTRGPRPGQGGPPNSGCRFTKEHHRLLYLQP